MSTNASGARTKCLRRFSKLVGCVYFARQQLGAVTFIKESCRIKAAKGQGGSRAAHALLI